MSYSEFTFQSLRDQLALHLMQDAALFAHVEAVAVSEYLQTTLQENVALALNINTEKARSEMIIVEAKNENIKAGLPQCIAAMYAAKIYNEREHNEVERLLGIVTTGSNWKFLTLEDTHVLIDYDEYLIDQAGKILAIILQALMPQSQVAMRQ